MWPLYVLFNKFLGPQEENVHGPDVSNLSFISSFPFIQLPNGNVYNSMVVSRSFSVEVSQIVHSHFINCCFCFSRFASSNVGDMVVFVNVVITLMACVLALGSAHQPTTYMGLRSCLCCDGFENSWLQ